MRDSWPTCRHHLIDRDAGGGLLVTDKFLRVYLARPELLPPSDACGAEQKLYAALRAAPPPPPGSPPPRGFRVTRCCGPRDCGIARSVLPPPSSAKLHCPLRLCL